MTYIDLSKYVGRKVILTLNNEETLSGEVQFLKNHHNAYCYVVSGWQFTINGKGYSKPQIKSILGKNPMTGIAQQHPNINLKDFEGQRCYVKWNDGVEAVGCVESTASNRWDIPGNLNRFFGKDGVHTNKALYVTEIYGEGAYEIITKDTFDTPSDDVVTKVTEALKDLTEEQIAKVLHALKGK
jgi:small nuclear ribonucleoprotein (snRNP)-like protein